MLTVLLLTFWEYCSNNGDIEASIASLNPQLEEQWTWGFPPTFLQHNKPSSYYPYNQY